MRVKNLTKMLQTALEEETPFKASKFSKNVNERTARRGLRLLEEKGLLKVEKKGLGINKGVSLFVTDKNSKKLKATLRSFEGVKARNTNGDL